MSEQRTEVRVVAQAREISYEECRELLCAREIGRIAVSTADGPHIVPLNYTVVEDSIVVRTTPFSVVATYGRNTKVAFEIDQFDDVRQLGWSVVARGRGDVVTDPAEIDEIRRICAPHPWADGARNLYFRIRWSELTGRRLSGAQPVAPT